MAMRQSKRHSIDDPERNSHPCFSNKQGKGAPRHPPHGLQATHEEDAEASIYRF